MDASQRNVEVQHLSAELFEAASAMRRDGESIARQAGQTQARWQVMWIAATGRLTVPSIARRLGIARQNVQRVANELVDEDLVTFEPNPDHARSPLLILTPQGQHILETINQAAARRNNQTAAALGDDGIRQLRHYLGQLRDALTTPHPE